jgi:hypothetical protein
LPYRNIVIPKNPPFCPPFNKAGKIKGDFKKERLKRSTTKKDKL